jgi:hypothetical protein
MHPLNHRGIPFFNQHLQKLTKQSTQWNIISVFLESCGNNSSKRGVQILISQLIQWKPKYGSYARELR